MNSNNISFDQVKNDFPSTIIASYSTAQKLPKKNFINIIFDITEENGHKQIGLSPIHLGRAITIISSNNYNLTLEPARSLFLTGCQSAKKARQEGTVLGKMLNQIWQENSSYCDENFEQELIERIVALEKKTIFRKEFLCVVSKIQKKERMISLSNIQVISFKMFYNAVTNFGQFSFSKLGQSSIQLVREQLKLVIGKIPVCFNESFGLGEMRKDLLLENRQQKEKREKNGSTSQYT